MKKIAIILFALMLASYLFTACQKAKEPVQKEEVKQQPSDIATEVQPKQEKQIPHILKMEGKNNKIKEIEPTVLTEEEQKEFKGGLEGEITFEEALKSLRILIKGDYKTIRWYQEWGKKYNFNEEHIRDRYEDDLCAAVKKIATVKAFPAIKARAQSKALPVLKLKDEFDLTLKVIKIKTSFPKAVTCAAEAIGWYQDKRAIPILKGLIKNKDPEIRLQSAGSLLILGEGNLALPVLGEIAKSGIHQSTFALERLFKWEVKKEFGETPVISHTKLWDRRGKEILVKALNYSSDEVKAFAAASLAQMGEKRRIVEDISIKILKRNLWKESSDRRANYHAIYALEILYSKNAIPILEDIINNPDAGYIADRAREALNKIKN